MSLADINPQVDPGSDATSADVGSAPAVNGGSLKDTAVNSRWSLSVSMPSLTRTGASNAFNSVKNAQITQDLANGPVATSVKNEAAATGNEFSALAGSRQPPTHTAANETPLTHYHSFFYTLLSWKNPRATGATFAGVLVFIFACRYLPILRYGLKLTWMTLGVVTLAEAASKLVAGGSLTSSLRPRRYYKIPKETLEATLDDIEQFINFFVIESQRIVFAENIAVTAAVFLGTFSSYYLVKLLPAWGMALLATSVVFLGPLIYVLNKELIDSNLEYAGQVVNEQAQQVRSVAGQQAGKGLESVKSYAGEYAGAASDLLGKSRQKIPHLQNSVQQEDFPAAPKTDLPSEPAIKTTEAQPKPAVNLMDTEAEPVPAS